MPTSTTEQCDVVTTLQSRALPALHKMCVALRSPRAGCTHVGAVFVIQKRCYTAEKMPSQTLQAAEATQESFTHSKGTGSNIETAEGMPAGALPTPTAGATVLEHPEFLLTTC